MNTDAMRKLNILRASLFTDNRFCFGSAEPPCTDPYVVGGVGGTLSVGRSYPDLADATLLSGEEEHVLSLDFCQDLLKHPALSSPQTV